VWDAVTGQELLSLQGHADSVRAVAFSPDGKRLAAGTGGLNKPGEVQVWDVTTGRELPSLKGHAAEVTCVAFSPDGNRLASASYDRTVKMWNADTGQEVVTLKGHTNTVSSVCWSPDSKCLASASWDQTVKVWEASPVPAEVWRQRELVRRVRSLSEELLLREEVLAALRKDSSLDESDRTFALQVAKTHPENEVALNEAAWKLVQARDAGKDAYTRALYHAEAAVRLAPGDGNILNTLGVAQYRAGRYVEALATLTKSEKLNTTRQGTLPADLAFLAMTQQRLGQKDEAKGILARLREVMKQPRWAKDAEAASFLREAEGLIEGKGGGKKE
jgi:hypothetical protein